MLKGIDTNHIEEKMEDMGFGLNDKYNIRGIFIPPDTPYVYSCFPAFMFYHLIGREDKTNEIIQALDSIGRYNNGMMKYCSTEINYLVPNVTPLASLMYKIAGRDYDSEELIDALREHQLEDGNWYYTNPGDEILYGKEDSMHLCMMVYALELLEAHDIIEKTMPEIMKINSLNIQGGTIGWGYPWLMIVTRNYPELKSMHDKAKNKTIELLKEKTSNFRSKVMAIWSLAIMDCENVGKDNSV